MNTSYGVRKSLAVIGVASILSMHAKSALAVDAPVISANGATISWPAINAITINAHDANGTWLESIPGNLTSWVAPYQGSFFMVGADHGSWESWGKSNIATVSFEEQQVTEATQIQFTDGISSVLSNPTPEELIGLAALVYSDSTLELIWPKGSLHARDLHHIVYQNGKEIAQTDGYSLVVDNLQAGTIYAFEVHRVTVNGEFDDIYRAHARTRNTAPNLELLPLNADAVYQSLAPTAISELDSDFTRVKTWLYQTHDITGFDPEKPHDGIVELVGTYDCPVAGTVTIERFDSVYSDKHHYTFNECQFPQTAESPSKFTNTVLYYFSVLDGRLERDTNFYSDSGGSSRSFQFRTEGFEALRHNGSLVTFKGLAEQSSAYTVLKAQSLPNGDYVQTQKARYELETFSDSTIAPGTQFEDIQSNVVAAETVEGINYTITQDAPVSIVSLGGTTTFSMSEPIRYDVSNASATANIMLTSDNNASIAYSLNGNLGATTQVSASAADGSITNYDAPFHSDAHLPRALVTQFCVWQDCNFKNYVVNSSAQ